MKKVELKGLKFYWILGLCTAILAGGCTKEEDQFATGLPKGAKMLEVNISGVTNSTEGNTKSAGAPSSGAPQIAVADLGNGMQLEAVLTPEALSKTRASTPMEDGVKYRVIAVNNSDKSYVSYADFVVGGATTSPKLYVPKDGQYDFLCISLNSKTELPADTMPPFAASTTGNADLLYGTITNHQIISSDPATSQLSFSVGHKFSQVTLVADATYFEGMKINAASDQTYLNPSYDATMDILGTLTKSGDARTDQYVSWTTTPADTLVSNPRTVFTNGEPFSLVIPSITGNDTRTNITLSFTKAFVAGSKYRLRLRFKSVLFAGSNIYWDGSKLTFDAYGNQTHEHYQGVRFKWGSLIGIGSASASFDGQTTSLYIPTYNAGSPSSSIWSLSIASNSPWNSLESIPFLEETSPTPGLTDDFLNTAAVNDASHWSNYQGDICQYLGAIGAAPAGYRMPKAIDFGSKIVDFNQRFYNYVYLGEYEPFAIGFPSGGGPNEAGWTLASWAPEGTANLANGKTELQSGQYFGLYKTFLPASGIMNNENFSTRVVGQYLQYLSASTTDVPDTAGQRYSMATDNFEAELGMAFIAFNAADFATPIRCIKIK